MSRLRVLGLTGSVGMGKSTAAGMLHRLGCLVFDADACVHRMMAPGGSLVAPIAATFGDAVIAGNAVDRRRLGAVVFADPAALRRLEAIVHPRVRQAEIAFLAGLRRAGWPLAVLDLPLLFEMGSDAFCHHVIVVTAPAFLQRQRVLARPGMTPERLKAIQAQQMSDAEKRCHADFVVPTGLGRPETRRRLARILAEIRHPSTRPRRPRRCARLCSIPKRPASTP